MKIKFSICIAVLVFACKISSAQRPNNLFGPNLGYSVTPFEGIDSSVFNLPYAGLGFERTIGERYRVGIEANYYYAQKVKGILDLTPLAYGNAARTTTAILEWSSITAELNVKKFFGAMREKAYRGFYTGLGATVAYTMTTNTVKPFNLEMYKPIANRTLDVISPFANVQFGYEMKTGNKSMLAPQVTFCIPVTNMPNTENLVMPYFIKMGITYRWSRFFDERWK